MPLFDVTQTIEDAWSIGVALVPVGDIPKGKFREYCRIIRNYLHLDVCEVNPEFSAAKAPHFPLQDRNGQLHLRYHCSEKDERASSWQELQAHKKVLGVIGVVHCPQYKDLSVATKDFADCLARFPTAIESVCFGFAHLPDQADQERGAGAVVMIPDDGKLEFYVSIWIIDFVARLLKNFDSVFLSVEQSTYLRTTVDAQDSADEIAKLKKKRKGRIQKALGDYCLLAGSPRDAWQHYVAALDATKSGNDHEWTAAALDGLVAAGLLGQRNGHQLLAAADGGAKAVGEENTAVVEKLRESVNFYSRRKGCLELEIETLMKLARYYIACKCPLEACAVMTEAFLHAEALSPTHKMLLTSSIARGFHELGYMRQYCFYLREAALLYSQAANHSTAHYLLGLVAQDHHLHDLNPDIQSFDRLRCSQDCNKGTELSRVQSRGWPALQLTILDELIDISMQLDDSQNSVRYIAYLLRHFHDLIGEERQRELSMSLERLAREKAGGFSLDMSGLPSLVHLQPVLPEAHLIPHKVEAPAQAEKKRAFIVDSTARNKRPSRRQDAMVWAEEQVVYVEVRLRNPMTFPVFIKGISLSTSGVPFEAYPTSLTLPPEARAYSVTLSGKPMGNGELTINGCLVETFNVSYEHLVDANGKPFHGEGGGIRVQVIPLLPLLQVSQPFLRGTCLSLYEGEKTTSVVELRCVGRRSIDQLSLSVNAEQNNVTHDPLIAEEPQPICSWDASVFEGCVLHEDDVLSIPLRVQGLRKGDRERTTVEFTIEYGSSAVEGYRRRQVLEFVVQVKAGLHLVSFNVLPSDAPSAELSSLQMKSPRESVLSGGGQSVMSGGRPVFEAVRSTADLMRAVAKHNSQDTCLLLLEVMNSTSHIFWLSHADICADDTEASGGAGVVLMPRTGTRFMIPLVRFDVSAEEVAAVRLQAELRQFVRSAANLSDEEAREAKYRYLLKHRLVDRMNVAWRSDFQSAGRLLMHGLRLTAANITRLTPESTALRIRVHPGRDIGGVSAVSPSPSDSLSGSASASAGDIGGGSATTVVRSTQSVEIDFLATNHSAEEQRLELAVQPYQELGGGTRNEHVCGEQLVWVGALQQPVTVAAGETLVHRVGMYFLAAGSYKFSFTSENLDTAEVTTCRQRCTIEVEL